jgi:hypothetical protein
VSWRDTLSPHGVIGRCASFGSELVDFARASRQRQLDSTIRHPEGQVYGQVFAHRHVHGRDQGLQLRPAARPGGRARARCTLTLRNMSATPSDNQRLQLITDAPE